MPQFFLPELGETIRQEEQQQQQEQEADGSCNTEEGEEREREIHLLQLRLHTHTCVRRLSGGHVRSHVRGRRRKSRRSRGYVVHKHTFTHTLLLPRNSNYFSASRHHLPARMHTLCTSHEDQPDIAS